MPAFRLHRPPHAGGDNLRFAAPGADASPKWLPPIRAVGKYLAGFVGQCCGAGLAIVDVGGRDGDFFCKRRIGIGADMGLEAMNSRFAFVLDPMRLAIILAGRCDDRRIDKRADLDPNCFGLQLAGDRLEQELVQFRIHQGLAETNEGRAFGPWLRS